MRFPKNTPVAVQLAVRRHAKRMRRAWLAAILSAGSAIAGMLTWCCIVMDRFVEIDPGWRAWAPALALTIVALTVLGAAAFALLWRPHPLKMAIRLDRWRPENEDRWASAIDFARRLENNPAPHGAGCMRRVFSEIAEVGQVLPSVRLPVIARRARTTAVGMVLLTLAGFAALHLEPAFNLPLLWQRFMHPYANLPRDSFAVIEIVSRNNESAPATRPWPALPEDSGFELVVRVHAGQPGWLVAQRNRAVWRPPQLEPADSEAEPVEFLRHADEWRLRVPRLREEMQFRIRAGDGLTAMFHQPVTPRLAFREITHSIRFPRYTRWPPRDNAPLTETRLSILEGAQLILDIEFDARCVEADITFEALQAATAEPQILSRDDLLQVRTLDDAATAASVRRPLRAHRRGPASFRSQLTVTDNGILRVRGQGENGLFSRERVVVIEALPDAPPRINITGIDADTTIMPGEIVAFDYLAEDDLAVTDLIMVWETAGSARTGDLAGEEYLANPDLGTPQVSGREWIQRMNYHVYGTQPFEFHLVATDSKGQEARSASYRIHILDDDYVARSDRAIAYLQRQADAAAATAAHFRTLLNQLNIIERAVGQAANWPEVQDNLYDSLLAQAARPVGIGTVDALVTRYANFPYRMDAAIARLRIGEFLQPDPSELMQAVGELKTPEGLQPALQQLRRLCDDARETAALWQAAAHAEHRRFLGEALLHRTRKIDARMKETIALESDRHTRMENLAFYHGELRNITAGARHLHELHPALAQPLAALPEALDDNSQEMLSSAVAEVIAAFESLPAPLPEAATRFYAHAADRTANARQTAFRAGLALLLRAASHRDMLLPDRLVALAHPILDDETPAADWFAPPLSASDLRLAVDAVLAALRSYRIDRLCGRYTLDPRAADDVEADLREIALALHELAGQCVELPEGRRLALRTALEPLTKFGFSTALEHPQPPLLANLEGWLQQQGIDAVRQRTETLRSDWTRLAASVRNAAVGADELGAAIRRHRVHADPGDLASNGWLYADIGRQTRLLSACVEGIEAIYRSLNYTAATAGLATNTDMNLNWDAWRPRHGLQVAFTYMTLYSREQIFGMHYDRRPNTPEDVERHYQVLLDRVDVLATDLRTWAQHVDAIAVGRPVDADFTALVERSRTHGHLEVLAEEFALVQPFLDTGNGSLELEDRERLAASVLGERAMRERWLMAAVLNRAALDAAADGPPDAFAAKLGPLNAIADALGDEHLAAALAVLNRRLDENSRAPIVQQPVLHRAWDDVRDALDAACERLQSAIRLPPVSVASRRNRRQAVNRGVPQLWQIQGVVESYDHRWLNRMRDAEVDLVRAMARLAEPCDTDLAPLHALALQYARRLELQARNLVNERRRNQGIALLAGADMAALELPPHIATEFFKGRNRRSPEAFRSRIQTYYEELYRDVSR